MRLHPASILTRLLTLTLLAGWAPAAHLPFRQLSPGGAPPPIDSIRTTLIRNFADDQSAVFRYRHTEHVIEKKDGKVVDKTQLVWFVNGHQVSEVIAYGNQPLTPQAQAVEQEKAMERAGSLVHRPPLPAGGLEFNHKNYPFAKLAQDYVYGPGKAIEWNQRTVWVYPAEPNPNAPDRSREEELLLSSRGEIWVDAEDLHVIRIRIHTFEPVRYWLGFLATIHKAQMDLELQRYAAGEWLPEKVDFSFKATVLLFKNLARGKTQIFSGYMPETPAEALR